MSKEYNISDKIMIKNLNKIENLFSILEKQWIEIQNGLECTLLVILEPKLAIKEIKKSVKSLFLNSKYKWGIHYHINEIENGLHISSFLYHNQTYYNDVFNDSNELLLNVSKNSYIEQCLNSEMESIKRQEFCAPSFISSNNISINKNIPVKNKSKNRDLFELKIDVNSYNFFESVHPAYAYQVLRIYKYLVKNNLQETNFIDIGTGPGSALEMLLELLPSYSKIDVIEPSPTAFAYLQNRFKDNCFINMFQTSFFEYTPKSPLKLAISVGSSHHFNTYFLFQHAKKVLEKNGHLIIADEFISPFKNSFERKTNIISHHISYICDLMKLGCDVSELPVTCLDDEVELIRASHKEYPKIKLDILNGNLEIAENSCRELLNKLTILVETNYNISHSFLSYYRLAFLELQALVAGLDYEVECKTYVENFLKMAHASGFSLEHHEKIYSTSLGGKYHSGTHLVCFKKLSD